MLRLIFWIVVGLLVLSFFGISLQSLVQAPQTQSNFAFAIQLLQQGWTNILLWLSSLTHGAIHP